MTDEKNFFENEENVEIEDTTVILTDEDGNDVEFDFLDNIEYEGCSYIVLLPLDESSDGGVVIMRLEEGETEDDDALVTLGEDESDIADAVYEIFKANNGDVFDFEEDWFAHKKGCCTKATFFVINIGFLSKLYYDVKLQYLKQTFITMD